MSKLSIQDTRGNRAKALTLANERPALIVRPTWTTTPFSTDCMNGQIIITVQASRDEVDAIAATFNGRVLVRR